MIDRITSSAAQASIVETRFMPEGIVLDLVDEQFTYPNTLLLKQHVELLCQGGHDPKFVLNLSRVGYIDSFGLAAIISVFKFCRQRHGAITLTGLNDAVTKLFEITKMDKVLDIWPTEGQALAHLSD